MKRKVIGVLCIVFILLMCSNVVKTHKLTQCNEVNSTEKNEDNTQIMENMDYLYNWNTNGCYLGLYGSEKEEEDFIRFNEDGSLYLVVESGGNINRELGVQIFLDYEQIPIIIDDNIVDVYYITTDQNFSETKKIWFNAELEDNSIHKVTIVLANYTDKNIGSNEDMRRTLSGDMTMFDTILVNGNEVGSMCKTDYEYEIPIKIYEEQFEGLVFTQDITGKRKVIDRNIYAKGGENLELQYHIASSSDVNDIIIIITIDMKQYDINSQKYIICTNESSKVFWGKVNFKVPEEKGSYEIRAFAVPNPFGKIENNKIQIPIGTFRFTLNVE